MKNLLIVIILLIGYNVSAQETTLFNKNGDAVCYVQNSNAVIFNFSGNPVAFLKLGTDNSLSVYNFNGKHIGWYEDGIFRDNDGNTVVYKKGSIIHSTNYEPFKQVKKFVPLKPYAEIPPYKPYYSNVFSNTPTDYLFYNNPGDATTPNTHSQSKPNAPYNHVYNNDDFVPTPLYKPDFTAIEQVLAAKQEQYNQEQRRVRLLESQGYLYDIETNSYLSPEKWATSKERRQTLINNILTAFKNNPLYLQNKLIKNGKYNAYYINYSHSNPMIYSGTVKVSNHKLKSMDYPGRKRRFKNATKIKNGTCTADLFDKFGFWENTMTYPGYQFYIFPLSK